MRVNTDFIKNRAIINVSEEAFGVTFTHWTRKRRSWSLRWQDVFSIDVTMIEIPFAGLQLRFLFQQASGQCCFVADDMENWDGFEDAVRKRFPDFNWPNFDAAKLYGNKDRRFPCWIRANGSLTEQWETKYTQMSHQAGDTPTAKIQFHFKNLDEYWLRWLGFCRLETVSPESLTDNQLFIVIEAATKVAARDIIPFCHTDSMKLGWSEYQTAITNLRKCPASAIKENAEKAYVDFKKVAASMRQD